MSSTGRWGVPSAGQAPGSYTRNAQAPPSWASPGSTALSLPHRESPPRVQSTRGRDADTMRWQQYRATSPSTAAGPQLPGRPVASAWPATTGVTRMPPGSVSPSRHGSNASTPKAAFLSNITPGGAAKAERAPPSNVELQRLRDAVAAAEARVQQFERIESKLPASAAAGNTATATPASVPPSVSPKSHRLTEGGSVGSAAYLTRAATPGSRNGLGGASGSGTAPTTKPPPDTLATTPAKETPRVDLTRPHHHDIPTTPRAGPPSASAALSPAEGGILAELRTLLAETKAAPAQQPRPQPAPAADVTSSELRTLLEGHRTAMEELVRSGIATATPAAPAPAPAAPQAPPAEELLAARELLEGLREREAQLDAKQRELAEGESALRSQRDAAAKQLQAAEAVEPRLAELEGMQAALRKKESAAEARDAALQERDVRLNERDALAAERERAVERRLAEREKALEEREAAAQRREALLEEREGRVDRRERLMETREQRGEERERGALDRERELDDRARREGDMHSEQRGGSSPRSPEPVARDFEGILPPEHARVRSHVEALSDEEEDPESAVPEMGRVLANYIPQRADVLVAAGVEEEEEEDVERDVEGDRGSMPHGMPDEGDEAGMLPDMFGFGDDMCPSGLIDVPDHDDDEMVDADEALQQLMQQGVPPDVAMAMLSGGMYMEEPGFGP